MSGERDRAWPRWRVWTACGLAGAIVVAALERSPRSASSTPARPHLALNQAAALSCGIDQLAADAPDGLGLHGGSVLLGEWDEGAVRLTHAALRGRVFSLDPAGVSDHSTHVAGTLIGDGSGQPAGRGMAPAARLASFDWRHDLAELQTRAPQLSVSTHAYGARMGWGLNPACGSKPTWFGRPDEKEDRAFGKYGPEAAELDRVLYATGALSIWAAGNERQETGAAGGDPHLHFPDCDTQYTDEHLAEATLQYDLLGLQTTAKNALVIGGIAHVMQRPPAPDDVDVLAYSSTGPTDDGRIKPELVASGALIFSTIAVADDAYDSYSGTSSGAAVVAGGVALLTELYRSRHHGQDLRAEQMRALLVHTAARAASGARPTYQAGFGAFDAEAAAALLEQDAATGDETRHLREGVITGARLQTTLATLPAGTALRVTLAWVDPPGAVNQGGIDDATPALVNDLDLSLLAPDGRTRFHAWSLDGTDPSQAATRNAPNRTDNLEVVDVGAGDNSWSGHWTVEVSAPAGLSRGMPQAFAVVASVPLPPLSAAPLLVAPRSVLSSAPQSQAPTPVALRLEREDEGSLAFRAHTDQAWLSLDTTSGTTPATLALSIDATDLPVGLSFGSVTVESDDPSGARVIGVTFEATCVPDCSMRSCGEDPVCGASCGGCAAGETCGDDGQCASFGLACPAADLGSQLSQLLVQGSTQGQGDDSTGSCGGGGSEDVAFAWTAPATGVYEISTSGSAFDPVLYVRASSCDGAELGCSQGSVAGAAALGLSLEAGETITVVVDGNAAGGDFRLGVVKAACVDVGLASRLGVALAPLQTAGSIDRMRGSCAPAGRPESTFAFTAPNSGDFVFALEALAGDGALYVRDTDCEGAELGCIEASGTDVRLSLSLTAGERVIAMGESADDEASALLSITAADGLCVGNCQGTPNHGGCQCDAACVEQGDCCADACDSCGHCCVPDCDGKDCGDDGCGNTCGTCAADESCAQGACTPDPCAGALTGAACDDGDDCTTLDRCIGGRCAGVARDCDDGDECTEDRCDAQRGACVSTPIGGCCARDWDCEDTDPCTRDRCEAGSCESEVMESCPNGEPADAGVDAAAGSVDAGAGNVDAGPRRAESPSPESGCGCRAVGAARVPRAGAVEAFCLALAAAWSLTRRSRRGRKAA